MTSSMPRRIVTTVVALAAVAACSHRGTSVGSPSTTATPAASTAAAKPAAAAVSAMPAGVTATAIAEGKTLFEAQTSNCSRCHGMDAKGTTRGPNLTDATWAQIDGSYPSIVRVIIEGVPAGKVKGQFQFPMAPKGRANITDEQVNSIAAYIYSISHPAK